MKLEDLRFLPGLIEAAMTNPGLAPIVADASEEAGYPKIKHLSRLRRLITDRKRRQYLRGVARWYHAATGDVNCKDVISPPTCGAHEGACCSKELAACKGCGETAGYCVECAQLPDDPGYEPPNCYIPGYGWTVV